MRRASPAQIWFHQQSLESKFGYNIFSAAQILGPLEISFLEQRIHQILSLSIFGYSITSLPLSFQKPSERTPTNTPLQASSQPSQSPSQPLTNPPLQSSSQPSSLSNSKPQITHYNLSQNLSPFILEQVLLPFDLSSFSTPLIRFLVIEQGLQDYILVAISHRILCDERSLWILLENLFSLNQVSEMDGHYFNLSEWLVKEQEKWSHQLNYWKDKLGGSLQIAQLPLDKTRSNVQGFVCHLRSYQFSVETSNALKKLSEQIPNELGLFVTLLSIFKILLYRHTGEEDIIIGSVWDTRRLLSNVIDNPGPSIGPFEEPLVFRNFLSDDLTFIKLMENVEKTVNQCLENKMVSYFQLLQKLSVDSTSHNPLYRTEFVLTDDHKINLRSPSESIRVSPYHLPFILSQYDLRLTISGKTQNTFNLTFQYNSELFMPERIDELFSQFESLSAKITADPNQRICSYSLITPKAEIILPSPKEPLDSTWRGSIQDIFVSKAQQHPDRLAIFYENHETTYSQLCDLSSQLANLLISHGIKVGDVVGIYGHRSPAVVVTIMGILMSGASYCMMDPAYPTERIRQCMDIAKPKAWLQILTPTEELQKYLDSIGLLLQFTVPQPWQPNDILSKQSKSYPAIKVSPESIAVITFTSGSTGIPKGVMGRHIPLTHYYPWMQQEFGIKELDRFSACSGIAHDPLQRDIFTPLFLGGHIYIPTQDDISQPGKLSKWFKTHKINVSCFTPAIGQLLTTAVEENLKLEDLRLAFFVGDCLLKKDVILLQNLAPNITVINMYGSTETQRSVGYYRTPRDLTHHKEVIYVGKGMKGCQLILLNHENQLAGIGEVAEIYVRSHHLSQGYIGYPSETEKRFLKNSFTNISGDRLYRTGDIGRYTLEGDVDCIGRADDQIKIRGFRIELGEISSALGKHPCVKENVTIVRQDKPGEKQLASYIVTWTGANFDVSDVKAFLKAKLPYYMVPTYIIHLAALPLTPNGKIDRKALPKPALEDGKKNDITETQSTLFGIWAKILGFPVPNLDSNFFDLGGHSLSVTQLTSELKKIWITNNINIKMIFEAPTIRDLSGIIDRTISGDNHVTQDIDFIMESRLSDDIRLRTDLIPPNKSIKNIFLTGVTGFLGAYLIKSILSFPGTVVHCLVRSKDKESALQRIITNLSNHNIWNTSFLSRIIPIPGDLSKELFGLDRDVWNQLSYDIDVIFHNGAMVHWLYHYHQLKSINVSGTIEVLKFAITTKVKPIQYISTTNVYDTDEHKNKKSVGESEVGTSPKGLTGGYTQSKWISEQLIQKAHKRNIPVRIYRPSYISGDSKSGIWNADDFLCRFIKGCIQLKHAPRLSDLTLDMSTVDYVADAIIHISMNPEEKNFEFNVVQDHLYSYNELFETIKSYGYDLQIIEYEKWRELLILQESNNDFALRPFIALLNEKWPQTAKGPVYDSINTRKALANTEIKNITIDKVIDKYFSYFISCGFLNPPEQPKKKEIIDWYPKQQATLNYRNKNLIN